jgi:hypothetical protein
MHFKLLILVGVQGSEPSTPASAWPAQANIANIPNPKIKSDIAGYAIVLVPG